MEFIKVAKTEELPSGGEPIVVEIKRRWVAIYNVDGEYHAIEDVCTHDGGPLAEGPRDGCVVACPRHGARFDVTTGEALSGPAGTIDVPTYAVKVEDGYIVVSQERQK
jgi:3-phenylpropionate/trans-cinnamate dioxygenase ferredoxin component